MADDAVALDIRAPSLTTCDVWSGPLKVRAPVLGLIWIKPGMARVRFKSIPGTRHDRRDVRSIAKATRGPSSIDEDQGEGGAER